MEHFDSETQRISHLPPHRDPDKPKVLVASAWIDPVPAAAIDGPGIKILLQPQRQEYLGMTGTEAKLLIAGRNFHERIERHLGKPVILAWVNEAILRTQFEVTQSSAGATARRRNKSLHNLGMKLQVRQRTVIHLDTRQRGDPTVGRFCSLRKR